MSTMQLPEVELNIYSPKNPVEATVVENYVATKESSPNIIRHITFDVSGTDLVGRVRVGQSIGVQAPGLTDKGRPHKIRLYSVSSPTEGEGGKQHLISTTVKRVVEEINDHELYLGVCSNYIANLKVGDKVLLTGPSGKRFLLPENEQDYNYLFFAAGTGIAPFRGMIMELLNQDYQNDVALIFGCPYRTDLLYDNYFTELSESNEHFHYLTRVSREDRRPDGSKYYVQTALEDYKDLLSEILKKDNTLLYICGLKGMEVGIYHQLALQGLTDYLRIKAPLDEQDPKTWDYESMKKCLKPSDRTFEEVY